MPVTFCIRKKLLSHNHYVFATLPNGKRKKVARFYSERDAESWVQLRGREWIALHQDELDAEAGETKN